MEESDNVGESQDEVMDTPDPLTGVRMTADLRDFLRGKKRALQYGGVSKTSSKSGKQARAGSSKTPEASKLRPQEWDAIVKEGVALLEAQRSEIKLMSEELTKQRQEIGTLLTQLGTAASAATQNHENLKTTWEAAKGTHEDLQITKTIVEEELKVLRSTTEEQGDKLTSLIDHIRQNIEQAEVTTRATFGPQLELLKTEVADLETRLSVTSIRSLHNSSSIRSLLNGMDTIFQTVREEKDITSEEFKVIAKLLHKLESKLVEVEGYVKYHRMKDKSQTPAPPVTIPPATIPSTTSLPVGSATRPLNTKEPKAPTPDKFNGQAGKLRGFLTALDVCFAMQPLTYALESNKIYYAASLLTDGAQRWWEANRTKIQGLSGVLPHWQSYEDFKLELTADFADPSEQEQTKHKLVKRFQGEKEPIIDYLSDIRSKNNIAQLPTERLFEVLWENCSPKVREEIRRQNPKTYAIPPNSESTIYRLFRTCGLAVENERRMENVYEALRERSKKVIKDKKEVKATEGVQSGRVEKKKKKKTPGEENSSKPKPNTSKRPEVPKEIKDARRAKGDCMNCAESGHYLFECKNKTVTYDTYKPKVNSKPGNKEPWKGKGKDKPEERKVATVQVEPEVAINYGRIYSTSEEDEIDPEDYA